jgi:hypothetical protein
MVVTNINSIIIVKLMLVYVLAILIITDNVKGFTISIPKTTSKLMIVPQLTITTTTTTKSDQQHQLRQHAVSTTTTTIKYKNSEYNDDYPIPIGTIVPGIKQQQQQDQKLVVSSTQVATATLPAISLRTKSETSSVTEPYYDMDNCYYPIPVFGGSSSSGGGSTGNPVSLPDVVRVLPTTTTTSSSSSATTTVTTRPSTNKKPVLTTITKFQEFVNYLQDDNRLTIVQ